MGTDQIGTNAYNPNCVTSATDHLYPYLKKVFTESEQIDINVSFLMVSGVMLVLDDLKAATEAIAITVVDHIIVAGDGYYSFAENRVL